MGHSRKDPPPPTEEIKNTPSPSADILYKFKFPSPLLWTVEISSVGGEWIFFGTTQYIYIYIYIYILGPTKLLGGLRY